MQNTPFRFFKHYTHGGGVRSPLVVSWPAHTQKPGAWTNQVGHVVDLAATILDAAHINKDQPELYDLSKDPTELNDLAATDPARLTQMITAWNKWATRVGVPAERQLALP